MKVKVKRVLLLAGLMVFMMCATVLAAEDNSGYGMSRLTTYGSTGSKRAYAESSPYTNRSSYYAYVELTGTFDDGTERIYTASSSTRGATAYRNTSYDAFMDFKSVHWYKDYYDKKELYSKTLYED